LVLTRSIMVDPNSKEPNSQTTLPSLSPSVRAAPRWSRAGHAVFVPASTAGLEGMSLCGTAVVNKEEVEHGVPPAR
jgi:hypothetical protein